MQGKNKAPAVTIRRMKVDVWTGLSAAARVTGRTPTQVKRHVDGTQPSRKLQDDMDRLGVTIVRED